MALLPLSAMTVPEHACSKRIEVNIMAIAVLVFFVLLAVAAATGHTADTRDSADWKPTLDGRRAPRWH
jgi:Mn2+/Fe2+ NRAMP family transporter